MIIKEEMENSMENSGIINCKYHSKKLNSTWCANCGNPICDECTVDMPKAWVRVYPEICPRCKQKKLNFAMKLILIIYGSLLAFHLTLQFLFQVFNPITLLIVLIIESGFVLYYINSFFKERMKHHLWMKTIDERTISDDEIHHLIRTQQLVPCKYHDFRPSINKCEQCGINSCINCSTISHFIGVSFLCVKCFWDKRKRLLKILMVYFSIPFIILLTILIFMNITFWGRNPLSFNIVVPLACLFTGIFLLCLYIFYRKAKKKYVVWKNEIVNNDAMKEI